MMTKQNPEQSPEKIHRYAVYSHQAVTEEGMVYTRSFIVIKNGYGVITRFTRLQDYAGIYDRRTYLPITSDPEAKLYYICAMLNHVFVENKDVFKINHIFEITKDMLQQFFSSYGLGKKPDGKHRGQASIENCISTVTYFMGNLSRKFGGYMKLSRSEFYSEKIYITKKGRQVKQIVPAFQVRGIREVDSLFRDIPMKAFELLLPLAFRYAQDIAFAICLQAFAGLRPGEVCNVRQEKSPLGAGIRFTEMEGHVKKAEIDLRKELVLRSDYVAVGRIKKERLQCVYPAFLATFCTAYQLHKRFLESVSFESEYCPMFVNRRGMAMTYDDYRGRFQKLVEEYFRPELLKSLDPQLRIYGQLLYENRLGPQSLRHFYTVQLVLRGEDIANIQFWRGDQSPQSAFAYLQNKGDLNRELEESNDRLARLLLEIGGQAYES
ncbi:MAG: hypothetical protein LBB91_06440 [Clostridiales bacterium]|jgi:integrase|nr:hypothetical protein [Clostridiales bacterium]